MAEQQEILLHHKKKKELEQEFSTSKETVRMALRYFSNSKLADKIRQRAKEMLQEEINKIEIEETK